MLDKIKLVTTSFRVFSTCLYLYFYLIALRCNSPENMQQSYCIRIFGYKLQLLEILD